MILLYINNMINCCQSLNGLEQINADIVVVDNIDVETEFNSLQTQIDNLQTEITNGGGYFQVICERKGSHQNGVYFSFGADATTGDLKTYLPNCVVYGIAISSGGTITSAVDIEVIINSTTYTYSVPAGTNAVYTNYNLNISVSQGQTLQAKFGSAGSGGTDFRISLFCRTSAVNGQNVNFYEPNFTLLNANQNAYLTDTITTSNNTQNHQLHFGIPRGRSVYAYLGSVTSSNDTSSVSMDSTTNTQGNQEITFNFVLQTGAQGPKGDKGDKGEDGGADPITIAIASVSGAGAGGIAGGAAGSAAGYSAGYSAGVNGANSVLFQVQTDIDNLQTDQSKTNSKIQFFVEHTPGSLKTECGGSTISLMPTNTLNLGGAVEGSDNNTNNINMYCTGGLIINSNSTQFQNKVEILNDLSIPSGDLELGGRLIILEEIFSISDIKLNQFLIFNNQIPYDSATIEVRPAQTTTGPNQGTMIINSNLLEIQSELVLLQDDPTNPPDYPFIKFNTSNLIGVTQYGAIICDTRTAPPVINGGDFTFLCNKLTASNNLTINGDLEVLGNFNVEDIAINNLTVNTTLKTSVINQKDDNLILAIGKDTTEVGTELFIKSETVYLAGSSIDIGVDTITNAVIIQADSLGIGSEYNGCGIIDIGYNGLTETTIKGYNCGITTDIINIGQNGTTDLVTLRGNTIEMGDLDCNEILIGRYNNPLNPMEVQIGNDYGKVDIYGFPTRLLSSDIQIGDLITAGDTLNIVSNTNNIGVNSTALNPVTTNIGNDTSISNIYGATIEVIGEDMTIGSNFTNTLDIWGDIITIGNEAITTDTTNIDSRYINVGVNDSGAYPSNITIGSDASITNVYGDVITVGDPNSINTTRFLGTTCNILTNGTSVRTNTLNMGSNYTTTANLTAQEITFLGTTSTTMRGDTINIGNDNSTDTIQIGNSTSYTEIEGSQINIGVGSILNTINIGNAFSVVNISGNPANAINVNNMFFNQIGF